MEKCDKGFEGLCCCNCKYFKQVNKHPMNKGESKGSILEKFGNVCTANEDGSMQFIFSTNEHGMCEMHYPKQD